MPAWKERTTLKWLVFLTGIVVASAVALVVSVLAWLITPTPFDPVTFETAKVQTVTSEGVIVIPQVEGFDAPSIEVGDETPLVIERCSDHHEVFSSTNDVWFLNKDTGTRHFISEGIKADIEPGCIQIRVDIDMPSQMASDLFAFGDDTAPTITTWNIQGTLTPDRDGGVTTHWESEIFEIVRPQQ